MGLEVEKERLSRGMFIPEWVMREHIARYEFASKFVRDKIVVDCACGVGLGTAVFLKAGARQVNAFDVSESALDEAKRRCNDDKAVFRMGSALDLPMPDGSVDVYISLETIEHLKDDARFLSEASRILKPDGVFICSTPNRMVTNPGKKFDEQPSNRYHVREYSGDEFGSLLNTYFSKVELFGQVRNHRVKIRLLEMFGRVPLYFSTRLRQACKLASWAAGRNKSAAYDVVEMEPGYDYEDIVAVCRK